MVERSKKSVKKFLEKIREMKNWIDQPSAFFPGGASPLATNPFSLRSMCQASV